MCVYVRLFQVISICYAELLQQSCTTVASDVNALYVLVYYHHLSSGYYYYNYCNRGELEYVTVVQNAD